MQKTECYKGLAHLGQIRLLTMSLLTQVIQCFLGMVGFLAQLLTRAAQQQEDKLTTGLSINYHFTRMCNYTCGFCFHTQKTRDNLPLDRALEGLAMLRKNGCEKINFSGGEPFLIKKGTYVGEMVKYAKEIGISSVTIISNGSKITEEWFSKYGEYLDILGISCDSFRSEVNKIIGRDDKSKGYDHVIQLHKIARWCKQYNVLFKINTVVNTYNWQEDMNREILKFGELLVRWKVFQCLVIDGENAGESALRNAASFVISDSEFKEFLDRHQQCSRVLVPEDNESMRNSYIILDEKMRFLSNVDGQKTPSASILEVGFENAFKDAGFDSQMFLRRGGKYTWTKAEILAERTAPGASCSSSLDTDLSW